MTHSIRNQKRFFYIVVVSVALIVASFSRLYYASDFFPFEKDQVDDLLTIQSIWETIKSGNIGTLEFHGQDGTYVNQLGIRHKNPIYHGVLYYYVLLPVAIVFHFNPYGVVLGLIALGVMCVYLLYVAGVVVFESRAVGAVAAYLGATSFWLAAYSRWIWTPSILMVFFSLVSLISLFLIKKGKTVWWYMFAIAVSVGSQTHASGYVPLVIYGLLAIWMRLRLPTGWIGRFLLACCFILPLMPTILYELSSGLTMTSTSTRIAADIFLKFHLLASSFFVFIADCLGLSAYSTHAWLPIQQGIETHWMVMGIGLGLCVWLWARHMRVKTRKLSLYHAFMFWWWGLFLSIPLLIRFFYETPNKEARTNNTLFALPIFLLCISALVVWMWDKKNIFLRIMVLGLLAVYVFINISAMKRALWQAGSFEWGYGELLSIAQNMDMWTAGAPYHLKIRRYAQDSFLSDWDYGIVYLLHTHNKPLPQTINDKASWGRPRAPMPLQGADAHIRIFIMTKDTAFSEPPDPRSILVGETTFYNVYRLLY